MLYCNFSEAYDTGGYNNNVRRDVVNNQQIAPVEKQTVRFQQQLAEPATSLESEYELVHRKKPKSHPYYIKKFLSSFTDDDLMSLASNYDPDLYQHIVSCKYCRMKINYEMKRKFLNELTSKANFNNNGYDNNIFGYKPVNYQFEHFNPNLQYLPNQQQLMPQQTNLPMNESNVQAPIIKEKIIEKKSEIRYEQYLMIIVVIVLILFLFADIVIKIVK